MINQSWRLKFLARSLLLFAKARRGPKVSAFYTALGDDVVAGLGDQNTDPDKPLWLNLGFWKEARTYNQAGTEMARLFGRWADLRPGQQVLDVGFGYGDQDFVFLDDFDVAHITGINITPVHVGVARERAKKHGASDRLNFCIGDATAMGFFDNSFDRVLALESAFHFDSREDFLREAFRVLKPGGQLAVADLLPGEEARETLFQRVMTRGTFIPRCNQYPQSRYGEILRAIGFEDVAFRSISAHVFPGMTRYLATRYSNRRSTADTPLQLTEADLQEGRGTETWRLSLGVSDYVLVAARKPL